MGGGTLEVLSKHNASTLIRIRHVSKPVWKRIRMPCFYSQIPPRLPERKDADHPEHKVAHDARSRWYFCGAPVGGTPLSIKLKAEQNIDWAAPTVSYRWPTKTELSRKVSENRKFLGRNISVICPASCRITEIQMTSCPSKKEFLTSHFCDLYRSCAASRK